MEALEEPRPESGRVICTVGGSPQSNFCQNRPHVLNKVEQKNRMATWSVSLLQHFRCTDPRQVGMRPRG